jgi:acyl-CoA synthetase (AMP-forming)/AMP-acid ligase II
MGKRVALLPSWYWPENVERHLGTPMVFLDEYLVGRNVRRFGDSIALIGNTRWTYAELNRRISAVAAEVSGRLDGDGSSVAVVASGDPCVTVMMLLGGLRARWIVGLLDTSLSSEKAERVLTRLRPRIMVGTTPPQWPRTNIPAIAGSDLLTMDPGVLRRGNLGNRSPALLLPSSTEYLARHSHHSLLSAVIAMATFFRVPEGTVHLSALPTLTWSGLLAAFLPLYVRGRSVLTADHDPHRLAELVIAHQPLSVWLPPDWAWKLAEDAPRALISAIRQYVSWIVVPVEEPYPVGQRKRLRKTFRTPVLPLYGLPETGPAAGTHPDWYYLDAAIGIPVTNAELRPVDYESLDWVVIPWDMIREAQIAVKGPQVMLGYDQPDATDHYLKEKWYLTNAIASMDANGMFYLNQMRKEWFEYGVP